MRNIPSTVDELVTIQLTLKYFLDREEWLSARTFIEIMIRADIGVLKCILIQTKKYKLHPEISKLRAEVLQMTEDFLGHTLV